MLTVFLYRTLVICSYSFCILLDYKMSTDSAKPRVCFERRSWQIAFRKSRRIFRASKNDDRDTCTGDNNTQILSR